MRNSHPVLRAEVGSGRRENSRVELGKLSVKRAETSLGAVDTSVCATTNHIVYVARYSRLSSRLASSSPVNFSAFSSKCSIRPVR